MSAYTLKNAKMATSTVEKSSQDFAQETKPNKSTNHAGSSGKRDLKRKAVTDNEPHTPISQGSPKKRRTAPTAGSGDKTVKPTTKGASLLKSSFARLKREPATPRPMQFNPGSGVGSSNSNVPLASRSNNTLLASSTNGTRSTPSTNAAQSSPKVGETLTSLRTKLASANKQLETATKTVQMLERTVSTKDKEVVKTKKEAVRAQQIVQSWKKSYGKQETKYEKLQAKHDKLKMKYAKLKAEASNLKLPLDSDSE